MEKSLFDSEEEPLIIRRLLHALQYHIRAQQLASSRRAKERIIVWVTVIAVMVTVWYAIVRS